MSIRTQTLAQRRQRIDRAAKVRHAEAEERAVLRGENELLRLQLSCAAQAYHALSQAWNELARDYFALLARRAPRTRLDAVSADTLCAIEDVVRAQLMADLTRECSDEATRNTLATIVTQARERYFSSIKTPSPSGSTKEKR